jgi:hypothetical protein
VKEAVGPSDAERVEVPHALAGTSDADRVEAPVTLKAYMLCVFASFGGIFFGFVSLLFHFRHLLILDTTPDT